MGAAKKGSSKPRSSLSPLLEEAARWLWGRGRTWALLAVVLGGFFAHGNGHGSNTAIRFLRGMNTGSDGRTLT